MKLGSVRYLLGEGVKSTWTNRLMSLASIGVLVACMVIIGLAILISENVAVAIGNLEQQNVVVAYMKDYNWALYGAKSEATPSDPAQTDATQSATQTDPTAGVVDNTAAAQTDATVSTDVATETTEPDPNGISPTDYVIHNDDEARALCDAIAQIPNVAEVTFISSDEGLSTINEYLSEEEREYFTFLEEEKYGNPLSCAAKITMKDMSLFSQTLEQIKGMEGIDKIHSQEELADKITAIKNGLAVAGLWVIAILMVISLVIVSNTIRVTMYSRKLEISIMKAVGATDAFVRIPFVVEGMLIGIISALIAEGLLYFCYRVATETIITTLGTPDIVQYSDVALWLLIVFVGIGVFAGILGSVIMISKYLRREGSEFAAI